MTLKQIKVEDKICGNGIGLKLRVKQWKSDGRW